MLALAPVFWAVVRDNPPPEALVSSQPKSDPSIIVGKRLDVQREGGLDEADGAENNVKIDETVTTCGGSGVGASMLGCCSSRYSHISADSRNNDTAAVGTDKFQLDKVSVSVTVETASLEIEAVDKDNAPFDALYVATALAIVSSFYTYPSVLSQIIPALVAEGFMQLEVYH